MKVPARRRTVPAGRRPGRAPLRGLLLTAAVLLGACPQAADAQSARAADGAEVAEAWRFPVGERAEYDVTLGPVRVGKGSLAVEAIDTLSSEPAYRLALEIVGGTFFYKVDDRTVSWVAPDPFRSLRFKQRLHEGSYERHRRWTFDHDSLTYVQEDWDEGKGRFVPDPEHEGVTIPRQALDEIAYLYLARSLPLEPGRQYTFDRYFKEDGNPVRLEVLRRETVRVPAGRFETVVVRPIIQTEGIFAEGGKAEVYMTDDDRRIIVQLKSRLKFGELNMYLTDYDPGRPEALIDTAGRAAGEAALRD